MNAPPPTCGLIVNSPRGWLLAHVTDRPHWDLPKGKAEPGEKPQDTALRECQEETGLDLWAYRGQLQPLGTRSYHRKRGKILTLFRLDLAVALDLAQCSCTHLVTTRGPNPVPEMDAFAWVDPRHVGRWVNARMARHLQRRRLIPDVRSPVVITSTHWTDDLLSAPG